MREAHFGFAAFFAYLKNNVCALPLAFVLNKVQPGVQYAPGDLFAGNKFGYLLPGPMHVRDAVGELGSGFVGVALDFAGPPAANIVDGSENFFRRLAYRKRRGVRLIFYRGFFRCCF